jgi:hypothetical protein
MTTSTTLHQVANFLNDTVNDGVEAIETGCESGITELVTAFTPEVAVAVVEALAAIAVVGATVEIAADMVDTFENTNPSNNADITTTTDLEDINTYGDACSCISDDTEIPDDSFGSDSGSDSGFGTGSAGSGSGTGTVIVDPERKKDGFDEDSEN